MAFTHITIIGVGLLGGSIGLSLKASGSSCRISGYGHRVETLKRAAEFGAIDDWSLELADVIPGSDLVILCTPVGLFKQMLRDIAPLLDSGTIVTDVGSTKRSVVRLGRELFTGGGLFVGSHPMAGSEKRGVEYARADLFQNAMCIVTPTAGTDARAAGKVEGFWKSLGMQVVRLSPEEHDAWVGDVSHLPHVLAAALVSMQSRSALPLAGKGFLDATRIASGDALLWRDILLDNQDNLKAGLDRLQKEISLLKKLLSPGKADSLVQWLSSAAARREELVKSKLKEISD
jgi:prephenate dehydrogenase